MGKEKPPRWRWFPASGGDGGIRTPDLYSAIVALSQLSYAPATKQRTEYTDRQKAPSIWCGGETCGIDKVRVNAGESLIQSAIAGGGRSCLGWGSHPGQQPAKGRE